MSGIAHSLECYGGCSDTTAIGNYDVHETFTTDNCRYLWGRIQAPASVRTSWQYTSSKFAQIHLDITYWKEEQQQSFIIDFRLHMDPSNYIRSVRQFVIAASGRTHIAATTA